MKIFGILYAATMIILTTFVVIAVPNSIEGGMKNDQIVVMSIVGFVGYISAALLIWAALEKDDVVQNNCPNTPEE